MFSETAFVTALLENDWVVISAGTEHPLLDGRTFEATFWSPDLPDGEYSLWMRYSVTETGMTFFMLDEPSLLLEA